MMTPTRARATDGDRLSARRRGVWLILGLFLGVLAVSTMLLAPVASAQGGDGTQPPPTSDPASAITKGTAQIGQPGTGANGSAPASGGDSCFGQIVQRPDCGAEPTRPEDRGGWAQGLVFLGILSGIGLIGLLGWRSARRARAGLPEAQQPR